MRQATRLAARTLGSSYGPSVSPVASEWLQAASCVACIAGPGVGHRRCASVAASPAEAKVHQRPYWLLLAGVAAAGMGLGTRCQCESADGPAVGRSADCGTSAEGVERMASAPESSSDESVLMNLAHRKKVFFKYERRIRDLSNAEKVFDYFYSVQKDGMKLMTPFDLLAALTPVYPPEESNQVRCGALKGERRPIRAGKIVKEGSCSSFDFNDDGLLAYVEFLLVLTLMRISPADIHVAFQMLDLDETGAIDEEEFGKLLDGFMRFAGQKVNLSGASTKPQRSIKDGGDQRLRGVMHKVFGNSKTHHLLRLEDFRAMHTAMRRDLVHLEFQHYDCTGDGEITAKDLARCSIAGLDLKVLDRFLARVDAMPQELALLRFTEQQFRGFSLVLDTARELGLGLTFCKSSLGPVTFDRFLQVVRRICDPDIDMGLAKVLFYTFEDAHGCLRVDMLCEALRQKNLGAMSPLQLGEQDTTQGLANLLPCLFRCLGVRQP